MKFSVFNVALFTATSKESNLCDDKWHSVEAKLIGNVVELVVDGGDSQYGSSQNTARNVTTSSALYVGGVPGTLIFTHFIFNIFLYHVHHQLMNKCYHSCIEIRNLCLFYWFWTTSLLCDVWIENWTRDENYFNKSESHFLSCKSSYFKKIIPTTNDIFLIK